MKDSYFLRDLGIEKVLASKRISFGERNYKYFTGYLCDNHKVTPLQIKQEAAF